MLIITCRLKSCYLCLTITNMQEIFSISLFFFPRQRHNSRKRTIYLTNGFALYLSKYAPFLKVLPSESERQCMIHWGAQKPAQCSTKQNPKDSQNWDMGYTKSTKGEIWTLNAVTQWEVVEGEISHHGRRQCSSEAQPAGRHCERERVLLIVFTECDWCSWAGGAVDCSALRVTLTLYSW